MKTNTKPRKPLIHIDGEAAANIIIAIIVLIVVGFLVVSIRSCAIKEHAKQDAIEKMQASRTHTIELHQPKYIEIVYSAQSYIDEKTKEEFNLPEQRYLIDVTMLTRIGYSGNNEALKVVYYRDEDRDWTFDKLFPRLSFKEWNDAVNQLEATPSIEAGELVP